MKNEYLLGEAPIRKVLLKLCIPSVVIMLVFVVYNLADIYFIGQTGDPLKVAAITLISPFFSVVHAVGTMIGNGAAIGIGISLGKKEHNKVDAIAGFGFYISLVLGGLLMVIVLLKCVPIVRLLGADEKTLPYALSYTKVLALGIPIMLSSSVLANIIRGDGSAKISMLGNVIGTLTNIILDPLLILGLDMGTGGAALATIIANGVSLAYYLHYIIKKQETVSLKLKFVLLRKDTTVDVLLLGFPMAMGTLLMSFSTVFRNNLLGEYGNTAIAASGISGRTGMFVGMLIMGIAMGIQPAISYNYGSGNLIRLKNIISKTWITTFVIGILMTGLIIVFRMSLFKIFINDQDVISYGEQFIIGNLIAAPFLGLYQLSSAFLQGTGKVSYGTFVALLRKGFANIPILFLMNAFFGLKGIIYTNAVSDFVSIILALILSVHWYNKIRNISPCSNNT